jgi:dephospho-CoA kinase
MRVFGLTGGIASGKSTVSAIFAAEGIPIVDADDISRAVVAPGSDGLAAIVAAFGPEVVRDGALDRAKLGEIVFGDAAKRRVLNAIVHPRVGAESAQRLARLDAEGHALACYDAALLVENGIADAFRPLVVVATSPEIQHARLVARDGLTDAEAAARLAAQAPIEAKIAAADLVLWNDADRDTLRARALETLAEVRRRTASA